MLTAQSRRLLPIQSMNCWPEPRSSCLGYRSWSLEGTIPRDAATGNPLSYLHDEEDKGSFSCSPYYIDEPSTASLNASQELTNPQARRHSNSTISLAKSGLPVAQPSLSSTPSKPKLTASVRLPYTH